MWGGIPLPTGEGLERRLGPFPFHVRKDEIEWLIFLTDISSLSSLLCFDAEAWSKKDISTVIIFLL